MVAPRAILFDTGGTVLDWHGSLVNELRALGAGPLQAVSASVRASAIQGKRLMGSSLRRLRQRLRQPWPGR